MKIKHTGPIITPPGAGVVSTSAAAETKQAPKTTIDAAAQAAAQAFIAGGKGKPTEVGTANEAALPGASLNYVLPGGPMAEQAVEAIGQSLAAVAETAQRRAKADKGVPPTPAQLLLKMAPQLIGTHHAIAEGYDENLEGKSPAEVGQRQTFSRAVLAELSDLLWKSVPADELFKLMPRETAALLMAGTPESAQAINGRVDRSMKAAQLRQMLGDIGYAEDRGFKLSGAEKKLMMNADKGADADPDAAYGMVQDIVARANKFLKTAPSVPIATMTKGELDAYRKKIDELKKRPPPEKLIADAMVRVQALEAEIAGAPDPDTKARFRGSMIGLAIGDALGGPTEFMAVEDIRAKYGIVTDMVGGGWLKLKPGEYTDDTQMAVAMGESILDRKGFDESDVADRFVGWLNTDPKDVGNLTRQSLELRRIGVDAADAGRMPWQLSGFENAGNGSVMRAAPVALFTAFAPEADRTAAAVQSSRVTHADDRCTYGTAALSMAVSLIMKGETDVVSKVAEWLKDKSPILADSIAAVPDLTLDDIRTSGYVVHTVQAAFWALHHATSYVDGIIKVSNLGEDTDTAGATAGILLGAKFGVEGIPQSWRSQLQNRGKLEKMADGIFDLQKPYMGTD